MTGDACEPFGDVLARWIIFQMRHRRHNFLESNLPSPLGGYLCSNRTIHLALAKSQGKFDGIFYILTPLRKAFLTSLPCLKNRMMYMNL
jgi:hypothetical protein